MSEDAPPSKKSPFRPGRSSKPTRKLNFPSRVRSSFRQAADKVLGADAAWSLVFVLVTLLLLGNQRCGVSYEPLSVGDRATHDIKTKYDVELPDEVLTQERRRAARESTRDVYVHDTGRAARLAGELSALFRDGRAAVQASGESSQAEVSRVVVAELGEHVDPRAVRVLAGLGFSTELERDLTSVLRRGMASMVVGNRALLERQSEITVVKVPDGGERRLSDYKGVIDLDAARVQVRERMRETIDADGVELAVLGDLVASFVDTNLFLDPKGTSNRREEAAAMVPPVLVKVPKGSLLVRQGEEVTAQVAGRIEEARLASSGRLGLIDLISLVFITSLLAFFLYRYASYHQRDFKKIKHLHAMLVLVQLSMLVLAQALLWITGKVVAELNSPFDQLQSYNYLIPLGAGSIMIALLANGKIAKVYSAFTALLFGAMNGWDPFLMTWALLVQWAGVYAISTYRERAALIRAGLVVGVAGAITAIALEALRGSLQPWPSTALTASLAFIGGAVGVGLVVSFALPLLEGLFRVLTDVRLLELSNLNTPLLSELAVRAPGSYNHSLVVGTLAEEGAKAIGANSLFCRVAAVYHDIGKMLKPEYYVENQRGNNPHDKLSPSMSALVVMAHVKDGIKLAREAGVPAQIVDIIPQHHGTRLMGFFYDKATKTADPSMGPIKEQDFRYPGPKPQTREAAIFMLADGVEAASRTIDDPSPNRLREMIRKVTNAIVIDGQFMECDLTFVDLTRIQDAFLRFLVSMYHHRVDYPGFDFGKAKGEPRPGGGSNEQKVARGR